LIGGKKIWIKNVNAAQITVINALNVEDTIHPILHIMKAIINEK
jgi:hypothetical protein